MLIVLVFSLSLFADYRGGNYKIADIAPLTATPLLIENDIIKGSIDSSLTPIDSVPRLSLRPGELVMRKKLKSETYGFFKGALDTGSFSLRPPLFSFTLPHWARLEDMLYYRLYRTPTEAIGSDEPIIYFDNERLYTRTSSILHYFRNGIWFQLAGSLKKPIGAISISSQPAGADIMINGLSTGKTTPCTIGGQIGGEYAIEVHLSSYQFFRKTVKIIPDSTVTASFELIADVDTVFITGEASYGLLLLPEPPVDRPYRIDDAVELHGTRIRLASGVHRIRWDGDERFVPVDSLVEIPQGKVVYFDYLFKRRYGVVRLVPFPVDAEICIDRFGCSSGERIEELPAGLYAVSIYRLGFQKMKRDIHVIADTISTIRVDLRQQRDSDGDGYVDSIDLCPESYGLYTGCPSPKLRPALKALFNELGEFISTDSLIIGFSLFGVVSKNPVDRDFRNFVSVFSSGKTGGMNNYRGLAILNSAFVTYRGLFSSVELGQWSSGLKYQRPDTLHLDSTHAVFYDSLLDIEPGMYFPSTAVTLGFHYNRYWFNLAYAVGYQWEDIVIDKILNQKTGRFEQVEFDNDWWFHQLRLEADFNRGDVFMPSVYGNFKFPFGQVKRTRWLAINFGLQLKLCTHPTKNANREHYEQ